MENKYKVISTNGIICYSDEVNGKDGNNRKNFFLPKIRSMADMEKIYEVMKAISEVMEKPVVNYYIQLKYECMEGEKDEE